MPTDYSQLPPLADNPAHDAVVSTLNRLRQTQVEGFLSRATGSHTAAFFLREVLYWLSPSNKAPERPRSTVFRDGHYWMARTQEQWKELDITRTNLATIYRRCGDLIETDHFMFGRQRQTHYRIKFEKLQELMAHDETLQACLQSDLDALKSRRPVSTSPCRPVNREGCGPNKQSLDDSIKSIADTGCAGACACVPSPGAAAPEPPLVPAGPSTIDSVEAALGRRKVTSFKQAQAVLQRLDNTPMPDVLREVHASYEERSKLLLSYLVIWQALYRKAFNQNYTFTEKHYLQAGEFFDRTQVRSGEFFDTLRGAWNAEPCEDYDPLFLCNRHARKFSLFLKHFRAMQEELRRDGWF